MNTPFTIRTEDMPSEIQALLARYPRDTWDAHPGFREQTQHWLEAHQMFRKLAARVRNDAERYLDRDLSTHDFAGRLSHFGGALVGNLHGHHGWEDHEYFPELLKADPRFELGLEVLEKDHADLDAVLDVLTRSANRVIQLSQLEPAKIYDETAPLLHAAETIEAFLQRHLTDEEELAVPIILHHRLRG